MSEENAPAKTYVSVSKLIEALHTLTPTFTAIRVVFSDYFTGGKFNTTAINILGVRLMNDKTVIERVKFSDIINIVGLNPWLNVGKQLNKEFKNLPLVKRCHCVEINMTKKSFKDKEGKTTWFYPLKYVKIGEKGNDELRQKLEKEKSEAQVDYINEKYQNVKVEEDTSDDEEFDPNEF